MILCLQCAMKARLDGKDYKGEADLTIEAHMKRVHPDPATTKAERRRIIEGLRVKLDMEEE